MNVDLGTLNWVVREAEVDDVPAIARVFGLAFEDYRQGFGVGPQALAQLWQGSLAARIGSTKVAVDDAGRVLGFIVYVRHGEREQYGGRREGRQRMAVWREQMGWAAFWQPALLFIPMGLAYAKRHARKDELYVSLVGVDPDIQGKGVGQALLAAAAEEARACGAAAILLHTASTNVRALASYARAGYELVCTVRTPWLGPARIRAYVALRKPLGVDPTPKLDALGY